MNSEVAPPTEAPMKMMGASSRAEPPQDNSENGIRKPITQVPMITGLRPMRSDSRGMTKA